VLGEQKNFGGQSPDYGAWATKRRKKKNDRSRRRDDMPKNQLPQNGFWSGHIEENAKIPSYDEFHATAWEKVLAQGGQVRLEVPVPHRVPTFHAKTIKAHLGRETKRCFSGDPVKKEKKDN